MCFQQLLDPRHYHLALTPKAKGPNDACNTSNYAAAVEAHFEAAPLADRLRIGNIQRIALLKKEADLSGDWRQTIRSAFKEDGEDRTLTRFMPADT